MLQPELTTVNKTFILPKLTYASPAWSSSLKTTQLLKNEKVQKRATTIPGSSYNGYGDALTTVGLTTLSALYQKIPVVRGGLLLELLN